MSARIPLKEGFMLKGYTIRDVLGGGGFSLVYLAYEELSRSNVVIKEYCPKGLVKRLPNGSITTISAQAVGAFNEGMKQFFGEASALAKAKHPNVVHVSDIFRANNTVYMVMEYEPGKDLRWFIKQLSGELDQSFLLKVFPKIASGLSQLHNADVLHLDVKPANILLRASGEPLLLDFGAAKTSKSNERFSSFQTLTHGFAPPEQYMDGKLGPWTDIYALGATIYACITGKPPPPSLQRESGSDIEPLTINYSGKFSYALLNGVNWALETEFEKRPKTIDAFVTKTFGDLKEIATDSTENQSTAFEGIELR